MVPEAPLFTIVIPVWNRGRALLPTVESVLSQDFKQYEIILVDDGSSDDTHGLLESLVNNIRVRLIMQSHRGVSCARNKGAAAASGRYLIFLDSDDRMGAGFLAAMVEKINSCSPLLVLTSIRFYDHLSVFQKEKRVTSHSDFSFGMAGCFAIEASHFHKVGGYDEYLSYSENTDLFIRLFHGPIPLIGQVAWVPDVFVVIFGSDPILRNKRYLPDRHRNVVHFIEKHTYFFRRYPSHLYNFRRIEGYSALAIGNNRLALKAYWRAIKLNPYRIKGWASFFYCGMVIISRLVLARHKQ